MRKNRSTSRKILPALALGAGLLVLPLALEFRLKRATQPLTNAWQRIPVEPRGPTLLGISFRTPQVAAFGLDQRDTLQTLLCYPFQIIRLGAYWNRIESEPGSFSYDELDWQIDAAEHAGKQIILCIGPLKTFGYPEFFVPSHHLKKPFQEGTLILPAAYPELLQRATEFITRTVERYQHRKSIVAWQLEHEAVDPLGTEHSWRLSTLFVQKEVEALRKADPARPIMMNGFLPASLPVSMFQWWQTRDQGDSLEAAQRMADIVGIDYYARHALTAIGSRTLYLDGSGSPWQHWKRRRIFARTHAYRQKLMISEGQAEPWEAVTTPPNPSLRAMYSCMPEQMLCTYNNWMNWSRPENPLYAYLFWGAEYWVLRKKTGDPSYMQTFERILTHA